MNHTSKIFVPERPIAFNREFVRLGIGAKGALMLSQAVYWTPRTKDAEGWFYKTVEEWEEETGLTRKEQLTAKKALKALGVLEIVRRGVPAKNYFRVNKLVLADLLEEACGESVQQEAPEGDGKKCQKGTTVRAKKGQLSISESTQENTAESIADFPSWIEQGFEEFWKLYPNRKAKAVAFGAYEKVFKKATPVQAVALRKAIHEAISVQRRLKDWKKDKGKFVPRASTWLNGKRWEDECADHELLPEGEDVDSVAQF